MSLSMWLWRVVFPGAGLAICLVVGFQSFRNDPTGRAIAKTSPGTPKRVAGERVIAEGRVAPRPGAEVTVGTDLGGFVIGTAVREKSRVRKGDLLVSLRADDRQSALVEAEARLAEIEAELAFQKREYQRRVKSSKTDSDRFAADADATRRDYEVALARKHAAEAIVSQCRSALARTRVISPIDGVVLACFARVGETVSPGARLVTVCDLSQTRIEAEVDAFDAPRVAVGAEVFVTAEGHAGTPWRGTVEEVPDRVADRSLRPEDPGRPSDTKVLLVKVATERPVPLKLGQQVEVEIRVKVAR